MAPSAALTSSHTAALASLSGPALRLQPDHRLIALLREGHTQAFDEIVRRYRPPLVRFAGGYVSRDRAEDVVQEGLLRAYSALRASDAEVALRAWLYTIVRNRALNELRDSRHHHEIPEDYDGVPQPPEVAERRERLDSLVGAVKRLPDAQREAIVRRELAGSSHLEIASSLGTTPGAVRQLIYRARTALRDAAGMLLPMPFLRTLLEASMSRTAAATGGAAAGTAVTAGAGGGAVALKAGAAVTVAALAIGSGAAVQLSENAERSRSPTQNAAAPSDSPASLDSAEESLSPPRASAPEEERVAYAAQVAGEGAGAGVDPDRISRSRLFSGPGGAPGEGPAARASEGTEPAKDAETLVSDPATEPGASPHAPRPSGAPRPGGYPQGPGPSRPPEHGTYPTGQPAPRPPGDHYEQPPSDGVFGQPHSPLPSGPTVGTQTAHPAPNQPTRPGTQAPRPGPRPTEPYPSSPRTGDFSEPIQPEASTGHSDPPDRHTPIS